MTDTDQFSENAAETLQARFSNASSGREKLTLCTQIRMLGEDMWQPSLLGTNIESVAGKFTSPELKLEFLQGLSSAMETYPSCGSQDLRVVIQEMIAPLKACPGEARAASAAMPPAP